MSTGEVFHIKMSRPIGFLLERRNRDYQEINGAAVPIMETHNRFKVPP